MKAQKKCILLAEKIEESFQKGISLSTDVLHFIDSTFSNPSLREFRDIFEDTSNADRESLIELIFSPDESVQVELENSLISETFETYDEKIIIDLLHSKRLSTHVIFPDGRGSLNVNVPDEVIVLFVSKLHIYWKPDEQILETLGRIVGQHLKTFDDSDRNQRIGYIKDAVTARMRSKGIDHSEIKTKTLCLFLEKADIEEPSFLDCMDYLTDTMDGLKDTDDLYETLSMRKHQYIEYIKKQEEFEMLLKKINRETLVLQGIKAPFIDIDNMQQRIAFIDTITLAVYGKIVYCL